MIVFGDVWDYKADCICIPTNGTLNRFGECVMGRGVAQQATRRLPGIAAEIGKSIKRQGNRLYMMGNLCAFPVKHNWWEKADLALIEQSAYDLGQLATDYPAKVFVLPRPGCGNGQRTWEEVRPVIEDILPDNVHVIDKEEG